MLQIRVYDRDVLRPLRAMSATMRPDNTAILNRKASLVMHADVIRTFAAQGATEGRPEWAKLKAGGRYVGTGRLLKGGGRGARRFQTAYKVLQDTGALRAAFVPLSDASVAGVGAASVKGHADLAPIHQDGNPSRNLPARPMLPSQARAVEIMTDVYGLEIAKRARS